MLLTSELTENLRKVTSDHTTTLKLLQFWPKRAELWFAQVEAQLSIGKITSDLKNYSYIVATLDENAAKRVLDMLIQVPATRKYTTLKRQVGR